MYQYTVSLDVIFTAIHVNNAHRVSIKSGYMVNLFPYLFPFSLVFTCLHYNSFENTVGKGDIALCFLSIWRTFCHFHQVWICRLQTLSIWKSLKFVVWERVKSTYCLTLSSIYTHFDTLKKKNLRKTLLKNVNCSTWAISSLSTMFSMQI